MTQFFPEGALWGTEENRQAQGSVASLFAAKEEGRLLEAVPQMCDPSLSLHFDLGPMRGVMPMEEVCREVEGVTTRSIGVISRVGKPCVFLVESIGEEGGEPVARLSRKKAQERCLTEHLDLLEEGDVLPAKVTHFEPFGAFCDIGCGIASLLSIDCISVSRIAHPSDRFSLGEHILCAVKERDDRLLGTRGRIRLTHKELLGTWEENAARFSAGQTVMGMVRSVESYGIFIELAPNLAGLAEWREGVRVGDGCSVYIKSILPAKMKIKLVLIDTFPTSRPLTKTEYFIREGSVRDFFYGEKER